MKYLKNIFKSFFAKTSESHFNPDSIVKTAIQLGIDKRQSPRALYPNINHKFLLPTVIFKGREISVKDISVGGICLCNEDDRFDYPLGYTFEVQFIWGEEGYSPTLVKVAGISFGKVHLQFLNPTKALQNSLRKIISYAVNAQNLRLTELQSSDFFTSEISEIWSGPMEDSMTIFNDPARCARIQIDGRSYFLNPGGEIFTSEDMSTQIVSPKIIEKVSIFLINIPFRSNHLNAYVHGITSCKVRKMVA